MQPGDIFRDNEFYVVPSGEIKAKYLLVLAAEAGCDIIARLLTSQAHGRPEAPPCFHGSPYAGFFLGVPGARLTLKTWVDLRPEDDLDALDFQNRQSKGWIEFVLSLEAKVTAQIIDCVAAADDTTRQQERILRDVLATLH